MSEDQQEVTEPQAAPETTETPKADDGLGDAGLKALKAERDARKAAEKASKDAEARIAELERQQLSDQERAVAEARDEGRKLAQTEYEAQMSAAQTRLAESELRAALVGKVADVDAILALTDASRFVKDGEVDRDTITETAERLGAAAPVAPQQYPPVDLGPRNGNGAKQLTQADLVGMTPAQVEEARAAGQFDKLLGIQT